MALRLDSASMTAGRSEAFVDRERTIYNPQL